MTAYTYAPIIETTKKPEYDIELRKYRVHTPLLGLDAAKPCQGFMYIPVGAILDVVRQGNRPTTYANVLWNDREMLVFCQDLSTHAVMFDIPQKRRPKAKAKTAGA